MTSTNLDGPESTPDRPDTGRAPARWAAVVIIAAAGALLLALAAWAVLDPHQNQSDSDPVWDSRTAAAIGHVHAIADDPADPGAGVLLATHAGVYAVAPDGTMRLAGSGGDDVMSLADAGSGRLLASGHPGPASTGPSANLGLVESDDAGRTWRPLSLDGADFHAIAPAGDLTWALDATTGGLLLSTDDRVWRTVTSEPLLDIAVDPADPNRVLATHASGRVLEITSGGSILTRPRTPHLVLLDWAAGESDDGQVVAIDGGGYVYRSEDRGQHWVPLAHVDGEPTALAVVGGTWYAATTGGLYRGHLDHVDAQLVELHPTP